jgi:hypothetical protein
MVTSDWWHDLSDEELADRLKQRGMPPPVAEDWVYYRDTEGAAHQISRFFEEHE